MSLVDKYLSEKPPRQPYVELADAIRVLYAELASSGMSGSEAPVSALERERSQTAPHLPQEMPDRL